MFGKKFVMGIPIYKKYIDMFQGYVSVWLLSFFLMMMYFPNLPVNSIPLILFIATSLYDWKKVKKIIYQHRLAFTLGILALVIGVVFSYKPSKSIKGVYDFLRGVMVFIPALYLLENYTSKIKRALVWGVGIVTFIYLGYVLFAFFCVSDEWGGQRAFLNVKLGYYNTYGTVFAVVFLVAAFSLMFLRRNRLESFLLALALIICVALLLYSGSRGSFVSLFAGMFILVLFKFRERIVLVLLGASGVSVAITLIFYFNLLGGYLQGWVRGADVSSGRFKMYIATLEAIWEKEKLFGFGVNTFKNLNYGQVLGPKHYSPHSVYLECLFSLGIVGTLVMLIALFAVMYKAFTNERKSCFFCLGLSLVCFLLVRGLMDMKLFGVYYPGAMAVAIAFMFSSQHYDESELLK